MCLADLSRYGFTYRERQVVERIACGLEIREIAHELGIGYHTAKMHIFGAKRKMGARNQLEVAILAHGGQPSHVETLTATRSIEQTPAWATERRWR